METPNIALITLDSVRADVFNEYASSLQEMATTTYTQCRAVSSWSVPSHASMLTGRLPSEHGVHTYAREYDRIDPEETALQETPEYEHIAVSANVFAGPAFGFDRFFDRTIAISRNRYFPRGMDVGAFGQTNTADGLRKQAAFVKTAFKRDAPLRSLANGGYVQLERSIRGLPIESPFDDGARRLGKTARKSVADTDSPWFLFMNYMDAHVPLRALRSYDDTIYDVGSDWDSTTFDWRTRISEGDEEQLSDFRSVYNAAVEYLDRRVSALVDRLQEQTDRPTVVIITADHGENLGYEADDYGWEHSESRLTEGLLHVPLLVIDSTSSTSSTVQEYVSHLSLPTLLRAVARGEYTPAGITRDVVPAERIGSNTGDEKKPMVRCVYEGQRKYRWKSNGNQQVYRLDKERTSWQATVDEDCDVGRLETRSFDEPICEAEEQLRKTANKSETPAGVRQRLESLGYRED